MATQSAPGGPGLHSKKGWGTASSPVSRPCSWVAVAPALTSAQLQPAWPSSRQFKEPGRPGLCKQKRLCSGATESIHCPEPAPISPPGVPGAVPGGVPGGVFYPGNGPEIQQNRVPFSKESYTYSASGNTAGRWSPSQHCQEGILSITDSPSKFQRRIKNVGCPSQRVHSQSGHC